MRQRAGTRTRLEHGQIWPEHGKNEVPEVSRHSVRRIRIQL